MVRVVGRRPPSFERSRGRNCLALRENLGLEFRRGALVLAVLSQQLLLSSPTRQETGWRNYALPRLQVRLGAVHASLVLAVPGASGAYGFALRLLIRTRVPSGWLPAGIIPVAILFTWPNNQTGGSLLLALLHHNTLNVTGPSLAAPKGTPHLPVLLNWPLAAVVLHHEEAARRKRRAAPATSATA